MKQEGLSDYKVSPVETMQEYAPISYVEPFDSKQNKEILGYNTFSNLERRSVMEMTRDTNQIGITENK